MVGIIALLLAIVIPSLYKAQGRVQTITCQSNLKQWGICMLVYSNDNGGYLPSSSSNWVTVLQPYSESGSVSASSAAQTEQKDGKNSITCCPAASKASADGSGQPMTAYTLQSGYSAEPIAVGSYGINGWVCNTPSAETEIYGISTQNNWRRFDVGEATSKIPLMLDSMWMRAYADNTNLPPEKDGDFGGCDLTGTGKRQMRHFCINRHDGSVNGIFLDLSVRQIGLKELWKLKWHRGSDLNAPTPEWPEWMRSFKNY